MRPDFRITAISFALTIILCVTLSGMLVAFDEMDRDINGAAEAEKDELYIGSRVYRFDASAVGRVIDGIRTTAERISGLAFSFSELIFESAEAAAWFLRDTLM